MTHSVGTKPANWTQSVRPNEPWNSLASSLFFSQVNIMIITNHNHNYCIVIAVNCLCIHNCKQSLRWATYNETLQPSDNIGEYFCRVRQVETRNETSHWLWQHCTFIFVFLWECFKLFHTFRPEGQDTGYWMECRKTATMWALTMAPLSPPLYLTWW